ncbi:carboxyl transferase [Alicycliphilus sp. B1]|nr:carboxyl transferase [Alicycliphilus sp. B1]
MIVCGKGFMFLGGPQLVQAATGEVIDAERLGGAEMHSRVSGVTDHIAENDGQAMALRAGSWASCRRCPSLA